MSFANSKRLSGKSFWPQVEMNTSLILVTGTILTQGSTFKTRFPTPDILRTQIPHLEFAITGPTTLDKTSNGQTMTDIFSILLLRSAAFSPRFEPKNPRVGLMICHMTIFILFYFLFFGLFLLLNFPNIYFFPKL